MRLRTIVLGLLLAALAPSVALAAGDGGRLGGVVIAQGTPQLGATVVVTPEARPGAPLRLVTDSRGGFASQMLLPGLYSVRVHLAGFLPAFEPEIRVANGRVTLLRVELGSIFSSIEQLRHGPRTGHGPDEWAWVLRSATLTRPVLRFSNGRVVIDNSPEKRARAAHGRAELTSGTLSSWSPANPQAIGSTSFIYDQGLGGGNRLLLAGRVGYNHSPTAGFAATWMRSADALGKATESTTVVFRQAQIGTGETAFRGFEIDHIRKLELGDRVELAYGGQYIVATLNGMTSVARPEARLRMELRPGWTASLLLSSDPLFGQPAASPLDSLDSFPTPIEAAGQLALDRAWHEEIALEHDLSRNAKVSAAIFHDTDAHTVLFGRGATSDANTIADPFSDAFVYNGGALRQWGARVGYKQKLSSHWEAALLYGWSRALAPGELSGGASLAQQLQAERRQTLGGRLTGRIERWGTEISTSYEWIDGPIVSRPDAFGAAQYGIEPYLNLSLRQPLPTFLCCRIVALVDVRNLLAQGYVSLNTGDGRTILIPAARSVRGGFAFQF